MQHTNIKSWVFGVCVLFVLSGCSPPPQERYIELRRLWGDKDAGDVEVTVSSINEQGKTPRYRYRGAWDQKEKWIAMKVAPEVGPSISGSVSDSKANELDNWNNVDLLTILFLASDPLAKNILSGTPPEMRGDYLYVWDIPNEGRFELEILPKSKLPKKLKVFYSNQQLELDYSWKSVERMPDYPPVSKFPAKGHDSAYDPLWFSTVCVRARSFSDLVRNQRIEDEFEPIEDKWVTDPSVRRVLDIREIPQLTSLNLPLSWPKPDEILVRKDVTVKGREQGPHVRMIFRGPHLNDWKLEISFKGKQNLSHVNHLLKQGHKAVAQRNRQVAYSGQFIEWATADAVWWEPALKADIAFTGMFELQADLNKRIDELLEAN